MSEEELYNLKMLVEDERRRKEDSDDPFMPERSIEEWLSRREKKRLAPTGKKAPTAEEDSEEGQTQSEVLQQLLSVPDLPPSLLPPPPGGWKVKVESEWG